MMSMSLRLAACIALCALLNCGADSITSIELAVSYDDAWQLERFDIDVEGVETSVAASHTVELWVPDSLAGQALSIEVSGMRKNQDGKLERYAFGKTTATPVIAEVVTAQIALTRLPCGAWCAEGESSCQGDNVVTCANRDDDSCLEWADPVACTGGDTCSLGACRAECIDECASGELRCAGPAGVQQCGNFDSDSCLEWSEVALCAEGESCSGGSCVNGCRDECTDGDSACSGGGVIACSDRNLDGCTEWGPVESCGDGKSCNEGACIDGCVDECSANTCEGATLRECGQFDADECLDKSPGTSCNPADLCIEGICDPTAGCSTTEKVCEEPPPSECINATTLRSYESVGQCGDGGCQYDYSDMSCANGCDAGACKSATSCKNRTWAIQTLDSLDDVGQFNSLAVDDIGTTHIGYSGGTFELKYVSNAFGTWQIETLDDTSLATYTAIGVDQQRKVHIAYIDDSSFYLKYATNVSGSWHIQTLDSSGKLDGRISLAVDHSGKVHISYYDRSTLDLKYATNASGSWQIQTLDTSIDGGQYTSIAIDSSSKAHIAYYEIADMNLRYATNESGAWVYKTVDTAGDVGSFSSIALDSVDKVHIGYFDRSNQDLKYITNASGTWQSLTVDSTGKVGIDASIALDSQDAAHISYRDTTNGNIKHATNASGSWQIETSVSVGIFSLDSSLDIDQSDNVHISYYFANTGDLKYVVGNCP